MIILTPLLLALVSTFVILSVSISYGIKKIYLPKSSVIYLTIFTTFSTFISIYIGKLFQPLFGFQLANIFGAMLLSFIGISFIVEYLRLEKKRAGYDTSNFYENQFGYKIFLDNPILVDADRSNHLDVKECTNLCLAISINNAFTFFAAGLTDINISFTLFFYLIISILVIKLGSFCYRWLTFKLLNKYSYLISGIVLIILGILEIFM